MRTNTATEASRRFSDLLDAIERGESVTVTRGNRPVAKSTRCGGARGKDLRAALAGTSPPDERFVEDVAGALAFLTVDGTDPWAGA